MTEIAVASPLLPARLALAGGIEAHHGFLEENGFNGGLELHPMRGSRLAREIDHAGPEDAELVGQVLRSAHQSYLSTAEGMVPHKSVSELMTLGKALIVFSTAGASVDKIQGYAQRVDRTDIPVVMYPEIGCGPAEHGVRYPLFQPNVRVLKKWGISTTEEVIDRAVDKRFRGIAWDGYHYLRRDAEGREMEDWWEALPRYLSSQTLPVVEAHVSIGRTDRHEESDLMLATTDELDVFLRSPRDIGRTVTGRMLRMIHDGSAGDMRYVVEAVPPKDMSRTEGLRTLATNLAIFLDD
ncbi:MAG: hypothetical protein JWM37_538 [Candidatus Saccharibacteria bacterium]|nr:hypothetical protein [Candidatus Saccharibacteria bacterium]